MKALDVAGNFHDESVYIKIYEGSNNFRVLSNALNEYLFSLTSFKTSRSDFSR